MASVKWIKITVDMFDNPKIKYIRTMPDGDKMLLIWIAVLTMAGRCNSNGMLILADTIPYSPKMIADEFGFNENTVQVALNLFMQLHMVETDDGTITIPGWSEYQSTDRLEEIKERDRLRKREERARLKGISKKEDDVQGNVHGQSTDSPRIPLISNSISNSLSFKTSNTNIDNLKYLLSLEGNESIDKVNASPQLSQAIRDWMEYKDTKKPRSSNHYTNEKSMLTFVNKVVRLSEEVGVNAICNAINDSMASNYMGVVWPDGSKRSGRGYKKATDEPNFDWEEWVNKHESN